MKLSGKEFRDKLWAEIKDLCTGAAFPLMIQMVFSASVILFCDYSEELGLQIAALILGEILILGAYIIFGRQNGIVAAKKTNQQQKKRELGSIEKAAIYKTGEYAVYKGFVIPLISCVPYILFQFVNCCVKNSVCVFVLKYAFGWAAYPFIVIFGEGNYVEWLNYIWVLVPVCVHAVAYILGARGENERIKKIAEAQEIKGKKRK
jgi:hypothetical protein